MPSAATRMRPELAGIRKQRIIFLVYLLSGIACGLAAVLWASRFESAQTNTALGFELQTVAASVVGGVSISGGVGTVPGVLLGALLLGIIQNALTMVRISPFWQLAAQGLLILIAVVADNLDPAQSRKGKPIMKATSPFLRPRPNRTLDQRNCPRRSFLARFQRWEWMLVGLILVVICAQHPAFALLPECPQSFPHLLRLHGNGPDDAADGVHHHHRQH